MLYDVGDLILFKGNHYLDPFHMLIMETHFEYEDKGEFVAWPTDTYVCYSIEDEDTFPVCRRDLESSSYIKLN